MNQIIKKIGWAFACLVCVIMVRVSTDAYLGNKDRLQYALGSHWETQVSHSSSQGSDAFWGGATGAATGGILGGLVGGIGIAVGGTAIACPPLALVLGGLGAIIGWNARSGISIGHVLVPNADASLIASIRENVSVSGFMLVGSILAFIAVLLLGVTAFCIHKANSE